MSSPLSHCHCLEPHVRETLQLLLRLIGLPGVRAHDLAVDNVAHVEVSPAMGRPSRDWQLALPGATFRVSHTPFLSRSFLELLLALLLAHLLAHPMDLVSQPPLIYSQMSVARLSLSFEGRGPVLLPGYSSCSCSMGRSCSRL